MTPDLERFLETATRPLEDQPDAREEARAELMGRVSHQGVPLEMIDVSSETEVLEAAGSRSPWIRRIAMMVGLFGCVVLWGFGTTSEVLNGWRSMLAQQLNFYYLWGGSMGGMRMNSNLLFDWQQDVAPELPITGNPALFPGLDDETRVLRERFPDDLAIFQEHLHRRAIDPDEFMTPEERAVVARLDPDNALWTLMESRWLRDKAYGRDRGSMNFYGGASSTSSADPDLLEEAWELYLESASKPRFRDYSTELARRQVEAFPEDGSFMGDTLRGAHRELVFSGDSRSRVTSFSPANEDFNEAIAIRIKDKDLEGLQELGEAWEKLNGMSIGSGSYQSEMSIQTMNQQATLLSSAFSGLGDGDSEKRFEALQKKIGAISVRSYLPSSDPLDGLMPIRGEMGALIPQGLRPEELKPGRMVERAFFDRVLSWFGVLGLLIVVFAAGFESYRRSVTVKGMARGLLPLFTWRDHAWVAILGVLLPWVYWWCLTRLTPLGFRELGMSDEWFVMGWLLQSVLGLVLMIVMLVQTVQWRWSKRGAFLGFRGRVDWLGWAVAAVVAMAIPSVNIVEHLLGGDEEKGLFLLGMVGAGLVGLLWLLWVGGMNLFTSRHSALGPNVVSRTLLPWAIVSALLMLLSAGVLIQAEKSWARKDTLFPFWTSETYANAFEERAVTEIQESLRKIFPEE